ncbi:hypothetical protein G3I20_16230 [Streptomyces sp. SID8111]|uniref:hypothetical protein n=1 Tax=Streptomyces sp. SID8111 TaxID=2706100 RepID=UPI0013C24BB1|nr:hypothetical protein [Streptomyces sp. SID8111]NEC28070.1 hypothetical protein [Streptomyces sp. SID8111]
MVLHKPFNPRLLEGRLVILEQHAQQPLVRVQRTGRVKPFDGALPRFQAGPGEGDRAGKGTGKTPLLDGQVRAQRIHPGQIGGAETASRAE